MKEYEMLLFKIIKEEALKSLNYRRCSSVSKKVGNNFPMNHDCRNFFFVWFFYANVTFGFLISSHNGILKLVFFFLKKLLEFFYGFVLGQLDKEIMSKMKMKENGLINSTEASGAKFISDFVFFMNNCFKMLIMYFINNHEGTYQKKYIFLDEWFRKEVYYPAGMKLKELIEREV